MAYSDSSRAGTGLAAQGVLQSGLPEISPKMLTATVRGLERSGLIMRRVDRLSPRRAEYGLSAMGESVIEPLRELCR